IERLIVGASDGTDHKAFVLDMGVQKLYKTIELASSPELIAADPSGCWALAGPEGVAPSATSFHNFCLRVIDGVLATSPIGFTAGALTSISGGQQMIITSSYTVQIRSPFSGGPILHPFIQSDLGPLNLAQGFFISAAMRPILTATPTAVAGLAGLYFGDDVHSSATQARANDATVNFSWPGASPAGAAPYSVRWTGVLKPTVTTTYQLRVNSDDGARVWLDGQLIIDDYYPWHAAQNADSAVISLTAGTVHPIAVEMYNPWSPGNVVLSWKVGAAAFAVIPSANLGTTMPAQPAAFALTSPDGVKPYGISYFNGSDTHVFPYFPYAFDFPASPGSQIAISPDDGVLAVMVPNVGATADGRRIDLYDINHDITPAKFGLRKFEFNHSAVVPSFRRGAPTGTPTTIRTSPIKDGALLSVCGVCPDNSCTFEFWDDGEDHMSDAGFANKTWHFFGKVFYKAPTIYSIEWRASADDGPRVDIDESNILTDWTTHFVRSEIGTETFSAPTADANSQREVRLRRFSMEAWNGGGGGNTIWADYMELKPGNHWGYKTAANVGNIYFPDVGDNVQKFFHGYNPPRFIRSIQMKFGAAIPAGTGAPTFHASDTMIMRMNPNGESLVVIDRQFGYLGEFNLYDNGSWSTHLPAGWTAESDVA
ncbi:MAG TPA: PA14 domain-containing protein, partial [Candidatus Ozemobacteraceae bacterium]|nr:PA14 domain-containing protein [Candidatus Ozemobacteraceae bacterium]